MTVMITAPWQAIFQPLVLTKGCEYHQQTLLGLLEVQNSQADEWSTWPGPVLAGILKARYMLRQKQKGQKSAGL